MNCSLVFLWRLYKLHRRVHPRSLSATPARFLRTLATWKGSTVGARRPRPQWWCGNNRDWQGQKVTGLNSSTVTSIFSTKSLFCEIMFLPSQSLLLWRQLWDVKSNRSHKQVRDVIGSHSLKDPSVRWQRKTWQDILRKKKSFACVGFEPTTSLKQNTMSSKVWWQAQLLRAVPLGEPRVHCWQPQALESSISMHRWVRLHIA